MNIILNYTSGLRKLKMKHDTKCLRSKHETVFKAMTNSIGLCCKMYPGAKFFTDEIKEIKNDLKTGVQHSACSVCWKYEKMGLESWRMHGNMHYRKNPNKYQIELYFDNTCDAACVYCSAKYSSKWKQEIKNTNYEPPLWAVEDEMVVKNVDSYAEYIFEYISEKAKTKKQDDYYEIILLGGEPLLTTTNKREILESVITAFYNHTSSDSPLAIVIQTNGNTPEKLMTKFLTKMEYFKTVYPNLEFIVSVSGESTNDIFEFIRYGCSFNVFVENLNKWASIGCKINSNLAVNAISLCSLVDYLEVLVSVSKKYNILVDVSINMVHSPSMSVGILDERFTHYCDEALEFIKSKSNFFVNTEDMIYKLDNIKSTIGSNNEINNFKMFDNAMQYFENVRKTKLKDINPELHDYICERLNFENRNI